MPSICETFRALSFRTWDTLSRARAVGHQPLEETFTDINLLDLKVRHPQEVITKMFTKPQEGLNGADWEWWLTNNTHSKWLGLRLQAKVLELKTNEFKHLHYKRAGTYQASRLKRMSKASGTVPLYCLYLQFNLGGAFGKRCISFGRTSESFGCSIASLRTIEKLRKNGLKQSLSDLSSHCLPWHCLVCCKGYGGNNLPERAWALLQAAFQVRPSTTATANIPNIGPRDEPPRYVLQLLENALEEPPDEGIRAITIIRDPKE